MAVTMRRTIGVVMVFSVYILLTDQPTLYCNAIELEEKEYVNFSGNFLPETFMTADEMIRSKGYPAESHTVQTEDGYLLTLHRIPHGRAGPTEGDQPAIFLQHTMLLSSAAWVITEPENSLAFLLADAGYDVWLGNSRGNTYSRNHVNKTTESFDYWSFSWHEMGKYDYPAVIDYILEVTDRPKLTFIAHSTGANTFFIMCSLRPEYNSKVDAHFSIAPDALLTTTLSAKASLERALRLLGVSLLFINGNEILTNSQGKELLYPSGCLMDPLSSICQGNFFVLSGFQDNDIDENTWTMIQAHFPAGTSYKTVLHYSQCVLKERYAEMDYGYFNYFKYHQRNPPEYDLTKVDVPVYIHYSQNDDIATKEEVLELQNTFPQAQGVFEVPWEKFSHLDFLWGRRVRTLFYDGLLEQINTLHGKSGGDTLVTESSTSETEDTSHDEPQTEPEETQTEPEETQPGLEETQTEPEETQPGLEETQTEPEETQPGLEETQTEPEETQTEPEETQPGLEETQTEPEETQPGLEETQPEPEETQTEPEETQSIPLEPETVPIETENESLPEII